MDVTQTNIQLNGNAVIINGSVPLNLAAFSYVDAQKWYQALNENRNIALKEPAPPEPNRSAIHHKYLNSCREMVGNMITNNRTSSVSELHIFTGTWNMAETEPPRTLPDWVGQDYDIYAIAVEECMALDSIRNSLQTIIGSSYYYQEAMIGNVRKELGYHGYIALFVFIRMEFMMSGLIRSHEIRKTESALGMNLIITKASNKGGVCVSFPVHFDYVKAPGDSTCKFGFISCHLPSDSKGKSKWEKRDKTANEMIRNLGIDLAHTRLFLMGDMNYRVNLDHLSCLRAVSVAMNKAHPQEAEEAWKVLKYNDQLTCTLGNGNSLGNFIEVHNLCFPPTYRKEREQAGNCGDFTNYEVLVKAYSHEVLEKNGDVTPRTPSFTDRVIYHPPFGCLDATYCD